MPFLRTRRKRMWRGSQQWAVDSRFYFLLVHFNCGSLPFWMRKHLFLYNRPLRVTPSLSHIRLSKVLRVTLIPIVLHGHVFWARYCRVLLLFLRVFAFIAVRFVCIVTQYFRRKFSGERANVRHPRRRPEQRSSRRRRRRNQQRPMTRKETLPEFLIRNMKRSIFLLFPLLNIQCLQIKN